MHVKTLEGGRKICTSCYAYSTGKKIKHRKNCRVVQRDAFKAFYKNPELQGNGTIVL